jgi:hypothetical protein
LFTKNTLDQGYAGGYGGGCIFMGHGNLTITSSSFISNSVTTNSSTTYGVVCELTGGLINITKSNFETNSGYSGSGSLSGVISALSTNNTITLNIGTSGVSTDGCYFSNNIANNGNDLYVKQSGANTNTVKGYYTTFGSSSSTATIYSINYNNSNGGSVTIANCGSPTNNLTITKTNTTAPPTFTSPSVPTYTGTCGTIVLPIELLYFIGRHTELGNLIEWETASEFNNDYFTLYRSNYPIDWFRVTEIDGVGTSSFKHHYQFLDRDYLNDITYYYLSQTDFDGKTKKYEIISIDNRVIVSELLRITNILGQDIDVDTPGIKFFHYSDGRIIKRY